MQLHAALHRTKVRVTIRPRGPSPGASRSPFFRDIMLLLVRYEQMDRCSEAGHRHSSGSSVSTFWLAHTLASGAGILGGDSGDGGGGDEGGGAGFAEASQDEVGAAWTHSVFVTPPTAAAEDDDYEGYEGCGFVPAIVARQLEDDGSVDHGVVATNVDVLVVVTQRVRGPSLAGSSRSNAYVPHVHTGMSGAARHAAAPQGDDLLFDKLIINRLPLRLIAMCYRTSESGEFGLART
jgi:hypothetical protein